jgi:DNA-binding MarR family transcriptional regulator
MSTRSPSLLDAAARQADPAVKLAVALQRVEQALSAARGAAAAAQSLSPLQLQLLTDLLHGAGGGATAGHFARRYGLSAPTISDSVRALVERKLVRATPAPGDARRKDLALTAAGRRAVELAAVQLEELVEIARSMPAAQRDACLGALVDLIARLSRAGWVQTDRMCVTCRFFGRGRFPGAALPHYCNLIERRLGNGDLRVDCPEHELAIHDQGVP